RAVGLRQVCRHGIGGHFDAFDRDLGPVRRTQSSCWVHCHIVLRCNSVAIATHRPAPTNRMLDRSSFEHHDDAPRSLLPACRGRDSVTGRDQPPAPRPVLARGWRSAHTDGGMARQTRATRRTKQTPPSVDYRTLADLRYHIRRFLRVREAAARHAWLEPQQYVLLLQIKGLKGREATTIGRLAERLQLRHHSTVELVDRLVARGLVARQRDTADRRTVIVALRPAGEKV